MKTRLVSLTLALALGASAVAAPVAEAAPAPAVTHSIWTSKTISLNDPTLPPVPSTRPSGDAATAWSEGTRNGYFRVHAKAYGRDYEFTLASIGNADADVINGLWDVRRDGVLVCSGCHGKAYGLSGPVGNYFKIYIGTPDAYAENWHYGAYIQYRFDFL